MSGDAFAVEIEAVHLRQIMMCGALHHDLGADWESLVGVDGIGEPLPRAADERWPVSMLECGFVLRIERGVLTSTASLGEQVSHLWGGDLKT